MAPHGDDHVYHKVDAIKAGTKGALITGGSGLFAASVQNALRKENVGALGVFTKSGGMIFHWGTFPCPSTTLPTCTRLTHFADPSSCRRRCFRIHKERCRQPAPKERPLQRDHWWFFGWFNTGRQELVLPRSCKETRERVAARLTTHRSRSHSRRVGIWGFHIGHPHGIRIHRWKSKGQKPLGRQGRRAR